MSVPPIFPTAYYRLLAKGAQQLGLSRTTLAMSALRHYLKTQQTKNAPITKVLSADLTEQFAAAQRKLAKDWWSSLTAEERKARAKKANQARWPKKQ